MTALYDALLAAYGLLLRLAALWNPKARAWVRGRMHPRLTVSAVRSRPDQEVVWIHCASLGEFEQGRPLLEAIRKAYPHCRILLTFFSPSGYEARKDYPVADLVAYLPLDGRRRARRFLDEARPRLALFVKYEHWHHYLREIGARGIPALSVSAVFRPAQPFFKPYGAFWRRMLARYGRIFVQDGESLRLLAGIGMADRAEVAGDTRFDRVLAVAAAPTRIDWMDAFLQGRPTLVAGSTWPEDERILALLAQRLPELALVVAPHEIDESHLKAVETTFPECVRFSRARSAAQSGIEPLPTGRCLVIDNIGLLSSLYRHATIAYVGGGFNRSGIHNILEAAVYGVPVVFGPRYERSVEAVERVASGGAFSVADADTLTDIVASRLSDTARTAAIGRENAEYVRSKAGATATVLRHIAENRLLSN